MKRHRGFSLPELLVVIAVVAVLAGLLFPLVGNMRKQGKSAVDSSNLRQIGLANIAYSTENNERTVVYFSPSGGLSLLWYSELRPYLGMPVEREGVTETFVSPCDPTAGGIHQPSVLTQDDWRRRSYSVNHRTREVLPGYTPSRFQGRKMVNLPVSRMIFLGNHRAVEGNTNTMSPDQQGSLNLIPRDWQPRKGEAQFVFLDGHVEMLIVDELMPGGSKADLWGPPAQ